MTEIPASVRELVRKRASGRCEYCGLPEQYSLQPHQVDHIVPQKQGGPSNPGNLALACFHCNIRKGSDVAYYDLSTRKVIPLFNPRTQKWSRHFEMREGIIIGKTAVGHATVRVLRMNHPKQVETRLTLVESGLWD